MASDTSATNKRLKPCTVYVAACAADVTSDGPEGWRSLVLLGQDIEDFEHDQMEALYQEARASDSSLTEWRLPCSGGRPAAVGTGTCDR